MSLNIIWTSKVKLRSFRIHVANFSIFYKVYKLQILDEIPQLVAPFSLQNLLEVLNNNPVNILVLRLKF